MDPLGFMRPYASLQDILFKQFTILSNHPAYHGILSLIFKRLAEKGWAPGKDGFAREFRKMEILWGLANEAQDESILNTTKYERFMGKGTISLNDIHPRDPIYYRLNYGTLGHYSSPSILWGLMSKDGRSLTRLGTELAEAVNKRDGQVFSDWLERWYVNKSEIDLSSKEFRSFAEAYNIKSPPSDAERSVWTRLIQEYIDKHPAVNSLWQQPLSFDKHEAFGKDAASYSGFFQYVKQLYPDVAPQLYLWEIFEKLAALSQFIFEREYLIRRPDAKDFDFSAPGEIEEHAAKSVVALAGEYLTLPGHEDAKNLFKMISAESGYESVAGAICRHHVIHQKSKGVTAFIEDDHLLVMDKVGREPFDKLFDSLDAGNPDQVVGAITYHYSRDWHFRRASLYSEYAGKQT